MNKELVLPIHGLTYGEAGIGKTSDGKAVFVPKTAPGDLVRARIVQDKGRFAKAELVDVLEPSPHRTIPACPYVDLCGGCPWMHLDYATQLEAKRNNVVSNLIRIAHIAPERAEALVASTVPSKRELGYRNKLELAISTDKQGRLILGMHGSHSKDITAIGHCRLAHKNIEKAPQALQGALRYLQGSQDLGIFRVGVRNSLRTRDTEIALWTTPGAFPRAAVAKTLQSALKATSVVRVLADPGKSRKVKGVEVLSGKGFWAEKLHDKQFFISGPSFFQVNTAQAERMIDAVIEGLELTESSVVADLYSGAGTFSLGLADHVDMVYAVESAASSVRDLRRNAEANNTWVDVIGGDAARELPMLGALDALVVDPPRAGLAEGVAESIAAAGPTRLAYVSCDPSTWARDVLRLEQVGYELIRVTPLDLFPQTYHGELVSIFMRKDA